MRGTCQLHGRGTRGITELEDLYVSEKVARLVRIDQEIHTDISHLIDQTIRVCKKCVNKFKDK